MNNLEIIVKGKKISVEINSNVEELIQNYIAATRLILKSLPPKQKLVFYAAIISKHFKEILMNE